MPQIASNFILRSKLPNFERDQFETWKEMSEVNSQWMDEGHISYCKEDNKHYIFYSQDGNLKGSARWTPLYTNSINENTIGIISVDGPENLNAQLAKKLPQGSIIYVVSEKKHYCNLYVEGSDKTEWFKPIQPSLDEYITKNRIGEFTENTLIDHIKSNYVAKNELKPYITRNEIGTWEDEKFDENGDRIAITLIDHIDNSHYTKEEIGDFNPNDGSLVDYINSKYNTLDGIADEIKNLISKSELEEYVAKKVPNVEKLVTKEELDDKGFITIDDVPVLDDIVTKEELKEVDNRIDANQALIGHVISELEHYKDEVSNEYLPKNEAQDKYVEIKTHQDSLADTYSRLKTIDDNIIALQNKDIEIEETHTTKEEFESHLTDFESFKEFVDETYVKPDEVSEKLNTYAPTVENRNKWIGSDFAGALAGKTGEEVAAMNYSYNAVLDQMLFFDFTPTVTEPSVEVGLAEDWQGPGTIINWHDKKNRIIIVKCGSVGPDGGDFYPVNWKDAIISYPKGLNLSNKYTNGPIEQSDEKQSPVGFCKVRDENGEWVHYRSEGNKYHVPAVFEQEGEYRYYLVAYFKKGSPVINNEGLTISVIISNLYTLSVSFVTII